MKYFWITTLCSLLLILGSLFFFYQQSWIIISFPYNIDHNVTATTKSVTSEKVTLWAFKKDCWIKESTEIIKSDNIAQTLETLLSSWLLFLEEEGIIDNQVIIQSVTLTPSSNQAFISFYQSPLNVQASTYQTYMLIESMLKTIRVNQIPIQFVKLLIHHQTLQDKRLNFECFWPIAGYLNIP